MWKPKPTNLEMFLSIVRDEQMADEQIFTQR